MTSALYEPLIERDLEAIPAAARAYADEHSIDELFLAVGRFAVLAYAPSMHGKRSVMAVRAAYELREECGAQWFDTIVACARYAAESRPPWSEPPILSDEEPDIDTLRATAGDDALLMLETALALIPILGEKGRAALLHMPMTEPPSPRSPDEPLDTLIDRAVASRGSIEAVQAIFVWDARHPHPAIAPVPPPPVYHLARDYAQTLIAHAVAKRLLSRREELLGAVADNLENGESFAEWT